MALLQISEPPARQWRFAVGIDLGTTNSLVATVRNGAPHILTPPQETAVLPSAVCYQADGSVLVGAAALAQRQTQPQGVITSVKRLMGRASDEVGEDYHYRYNQREGMLTLQTPAGDKSPVQISAAILQSLKARALMVSGEDEIAGAVITVPAYFDDAQRQATKDAARLAGLPVLRLLNEPTAAAVAYGLENAAEGLYAVYDLGGGTFDVSLLRLSGGIFEVLATGGDTALGGDDYDRLLAQWFVQTYAGGQTLSAQDWLRLIAAAKEAKEALGNGAQTDMTVQLDIGEYSGCISGEQFAALTAGLTNRTIACCRAVLADAAMTAAQIQGVVLVGGSTRMPAVYAAVKEFFGCAPYTDINPDEVVALGAAAQADVLIGNHSGDGWLLLDVLPLSLGLETMGGLAEKIIHRNTAIPITKHQEFTTHKDGQTAMRIHVVQGERERVSDCRALADFTLTGIPPLAAGLARVRVSFQVDADGLLSVTAAEKTTGVSAGIEVKPFYGLSEDEFNTMLQSAYANAEQDLHARRLQEAVSDGEQLVRMLTAALADEVGRQLLAHGEEAAIREGMEALQAALAGGQVEAISAAANTLQEAANDFAARRMNADISRAIAGKNIGEVE